MLLSNISLPKSLFLAGLMALSATAMAQHNEEPKKTAAKTVMEKPKGSYKIDVKIKNYAEKELYLGYHFGNKQYILDTAKLQPNGHYVFERKNGLDPGIFLLILPPKNKYFELLMNKSERFDFSIETDTLDFVQYMKIKGDDDNARFYEYLNFIGQQRKDADPFRNDLNSTDPKKKEAATKGLEGIDKKVKDYQNNTITKFPKSMNAAVMRSTQETPTPPFKKPNGDTDTLKQFTFYKEHFFDNFDLSDERLIRTPILRSKVMRYIEQCIVHHPDSINIGCDYVIGKAKGNTETYKYWITELLNEYAGSKIVGMDAVYVHLAEKYYFDSTKTPWVEREVRDNIIKDATSLKPLLIGKVAPDLSMYVMDATNGTKKAEEIVREGKKMTLHGVKSPYTLLIFWDTECSHCQKSMPVAHEFYTKTGKKMGVEVVSVCTRLYEDYEKCWKMINEKGWTGWINVGDPYMQSRYKQVYDIRSTPQVYLLDENKKIILKKISAEQFEAEIPRCIENDRKVKEYERKEAEKRKAAGGK